MLGIKVQIKMLLKEKKNLCKSEWEQILLITRELK